MSFLYKPLVKKPPPPSSSDASSSEEDEEDKEEEEKEEEDENDDSFAAKKKARSKRSLEPSAISDVAAYGGRGSKKVCVMDGVGKGVINLNDSDDDDAGAASQVAKQRAIKELEAAAAEAAARVAQSSSTAGAASRGSKALLKKAAVAEAKEAENTGAKMSELHSILTKIEDSRNSKKNVDLDLTEEEDSRFAVQNVFVVPKILTAAEREARALSTSSANLADILGSVTSSSSSNSQPPQPEHLIKLKMRLNGKTESKMKFNPKEVFSSIKGKFAKAHEIAVADILKFEFDGEAIEDDETPASLEMEDEYVIDVKIAEVKLARAVEARTRQKIEQKAPPPAPPPSTIVISIVISADVNAKGCEDVKIEAAIPTRKTVQEVKTGLAKAGIFKPGVQLRFLRESGEEELDAFTPINLLQISDGDTLRVMRASN